MKVSPRTRRSAKIGLLAGAAGAVVAGGLAHAESRPVSQITVSASPGYAAAKAAANPAPPPADDGLAGGGFYLEADELTQDDINHIVTARGGVEARYNGRVLRAEQVEYNSVTGVVIARGKVQVINQDGTAQFADAITLDKDMTEGIAIGFSTRLTGNVKIAAASAQRESETATELRNAIYTPCEVCAENGKQNPTWSIRAKRVIQDRKRHIVYYQHAVIQVFGVGVLYLPAFWTADPEVERKSGFMMPLVTFSQKRGLTYQQPYYQVITKSQDLMITPQINTKVNPFLNLQWRRRFYSGGLDVRAGYTYERDFDSHGDRLGSLTSRSYILSGGAFDIDDHWRWGFTGERASDDLIFDKYDIGDVFRERGLYATDDRRLISQLFAIRQDSNSYLSIAAISVQGLRPTDNDRTFPSIAPLIEGRYEPQSAILGGRLRLQGSAVILDRDRSPDNPLLPGIDSRRATLQGDWRRAFTLTNGLRIEPFLQARGDVFSLRDLPAPGPTSADIRRGFGTVGVDLSFPMIKQAGGVTYVIEPLAQVAISPDTRLDPRIPNEDSVVWEFDETNLFQVNKSPGFDLYEGGQRVNLGGRATLEWEDGRTASFLVGRSFRNGADPALPLRTGLQTASSDYILAAEATPFKGIRLFSRWRLDSGTLAIRRLEAGGDFATSWAQGYVRYLQEDETPTAGKVKGLDFRGDVYATKHWGLTLYGVRDIDDGAWRRRDIGIVYRDDCVRLEVVYRRDETFNRILGPNDSVVIRLTLATLGNSGYSR
jgi:LPS-assembly protein